MNTDGSTLRRSEGEGSSPSAPTRLTCPNAAPGDILGTDARRPVLTPGYAASMRTRGTITVIAAGLLLAACGGSTASTSTPSSGAPAGSSTSTPSPTPATLPAHPTGAQVADALGCGSVKPKTFKKNTGTSVPDPVEEVNCTLGGQLYTVAVYKTEGDLTNALAFTAMILPSMLRKPFVFGASDVWIVSRDTGKNGPMDPIAPDMQTAVVAVGGVVKTIKPS